MHAAVAVLLVFPAPCARPAVTAGAESLVARAQGGDQDAFRVLYREHVGRVYAVCLRLAADRGEAEDLTQDVFVRAWDKLATFRGESAFSTWLHRLTVNVVLMARRARSRRERHVFATDNPAVLERPADPAPAGLSLDLEQAIARLPEGAREVFLLFDVEGYPHAEIASLLGIAEGTSKAQLFRARRLLREWLER